VTSAVDQTFIPDLLLVRPGRFEDARGFFVEVYRKDRYESLRLPTQFVQLNHSGSVRNTVRGLHFQWDPPMGKLMRVLRGNAFLVAVDLRKDSPTFGKWYGRETNQDDNLLIWAPAGFARGFAVLSERAEIEYLTTGTYNPAAESGVRWNDPAIGVEWPVGAPILSAKDETAQTLDQWCQRPESDLPVFRM
jgi:dTDP-4-dehydrorhamnose 3,5-epimerase